MSGVKELTVNETWADAPEAIRNTARIPEILIAGLYSVRATRRPALANPVMTLPNWTLAAMTWLLPGLFGYQVMFLAHSKR
jgi:hypothetical protein